MSLLDLRQIFQQVHDESTGTLQVSIPSISTQIELDAEDGDSVQTRPVIIDVTTLMSAVPANANLTTSAVDILKYKGYYISISWAGLDAVDAVLKIQASADSSVWDDLSGITQTLNSASGSKAFNIVDAMYRYFRAVYTKGSNTVGTVTLKYVVKA